MFITLWCIMTSRELQEDEAASYVSWRATRGGGQGGQLRHTAASYLCTDLCAGLLVMNKAALELLSTHLLCTYIFIWDKCLVMELQDHWISVYLLIWDIARTFTKEIAQAHKIYGSFIVSLTFGDINQFILTREEGVQWVVHYGFYFSFP